jgi:uncharacterized integral membrane protein
MADNDRQVQITSDPIRSPTEQAKLIGAAVAAVVVLLFFLQNMQETTIHFLWMDWDMDTAWALLLSAVLGGIAVFFGMWFIGRRTQDGR